MKNNIVLAFGTITAALSDRLRDPLDPRVPGTGQLKDQLRDLSALLDAGSFPEARWHMMRLESFIADWDIVAQALPAYTNELRRRIVRDDQRAGYVGARSELAFAAFLVRKDVPLERGPKEGADFLVQRSDGNVIIECTSAHLSSPREDNFHKIESAIRRKSRHPYCGPDALLYVDYTAIMRHGGDSLDRDFPERVTSMVTDTDWGAVVLGAFMVSPEGNQYHRGFLRSDGVSPTKALQGFLDEVLPSGAHRLGPVSIPPTP